MLNFFRQMLKQSYWRTFFNSYTVRIEKPREWTHSLDAATVIQQSCGHGRKPGFLSLLSFINRIFNVIAPALRAISAAFNHVKVVVCVLCFAFLCLDMLHCISFCIKVIYSDKTPHEMIKHTAVSHKYEATSQNIGMSHQKSIQTFAK